MATQPPGRPWPGTQAPAPAQFSCLPIFAKRLASYGLAQVWAKARQPNTLMMALEAMGSKLWMIISVLSVSCFDRSWDIVELSRAGEQGNGYNQTNTRLLRSLDTRSPPPVLGDIIPRSPLHHGSFLGNSGQLGHWRLCLDPANISDIYQTGNFNENKNMGHRQLKLKSK